MRRVDAAGVGSGALQSRAVSPRRGAEGLAETVVEMAGTGKAAGQGHFSQWQRAVLQQVLTMAQALRQHITVRRQAEAELELSGEVVFGERTQTGQLTQAERFTEVGLDKLAH